MASRSCWPPQANHPTPGPQLGGWKQCTRVGGQQHLLITLGGHPTAHPVNSSGRVATSFCRSPQAKTQHVDQSWVIASPGHWRQCKRVGGQQLRSWQPPQSPHSVCCKARKAAKPQAKKRGTEDLDKTAWASNTQQPAPRWVVGSSAKERRVASSICWSPLVITQPHQCVLPGKKSGRATSKESPPNPQTDGLCQ